MHSLDLLKLCQRITILLLLTTTTYNLLASAQDFSHDNPEEWPMQFPQCGGKRQSPIAINTETSLQVWLPPIIFTSYEALFSKLIVLQNVGYTLKFGIPRTEEGIFPSITGGPLNDIYEAAEVHFHWGSPTSKGSEHLINNKRSDVEMHIVHKNTKYASVNEATGFVDGLAVLGVFLKEEKTILDIFTPGLNTVYNSIPMIALYNSTATARPKISLGSLLNNINRQNYYTYQGSLTTPACAEAVTWIVYPEAIPISSVQLHNFWLLRDKSFGNLWNNYRPVQPIGMRSVYHTNPFLQF